MTTWPQVLSRDAWRLWQYLNAGPVAQLTLAELGRAVGVSKAKARRALLELEEHGFLSIQQEVL